MGDPYINLTLTLMVVQTTVAGHTVHIATHSHITHKHNKWSSLIPKFYRKEYNNKTMLCAVHNINLYYIVNPTFYQYLVN